MQDIVRALDRVDFGDRILLLGASLLLSVLPLIIVLSAYTTNRVQDEISGHLGLSRQGAHIVEGLFRATDRSFDLALLVGLVVAFSGTVAVARSVEVVYERAFDHPPLAGMKSLVRCVVWVFVVGALTFGDAAIGKTLRDDPAGPLVIGSVEFVGFTLFFWWSIHFLLAGREPWRRIAPAAVVTSLLWIGLGVFAAFYFSPSIVSDSENYGPIGVTFTLGTWFIAIAAVLTLGTVLGAVWRKRMDQRHATAEASDAGEGLASVGIREVLEGRPEHQDLGHT